MGSELKLFKSETFDEADEHRDDSSDIGAEKNGKNMRKTGQKIPWRFPLNSQCTIVTCY